jgi:hypothetical protein
MRVSNIDSISALLDRLITERIKLYFFTKSLEQDKVKHQTSVIKEITGKLSTALTEVFEGKYESLEELRTFSNNVADELLQLTFDDIEIGESDRARLEEIKTNKPKVKNLAKNEVRLRVSNETRSASKNRLEEMFRNQSKKLRTN